MITGHIVADVEGTHFTALQAFAARLGIRTTPEAIRRVIEITPEFQALVSIYNEPQKKDETAA